MARPAMREPFGRWSVAQVAAEAGITPRTARTLVTNHVLNPHMLGYKDVLVARVGAALLDAPRPAGQTRTQAEPVIKARDDRAIAHAREVMDNPTAARDTLLAIFPTEVRLAEGMKVLGVIGDLGDQPLLLLPVGEWATALRASIASAAAPEAS